MSPSHQFDPDLYGDPPRKKVGGCSPITLLLAIFLATFLFVQMRGCEEQQRREKEAENERSTEIEAARDASRSNARLDENRRRADQGDWSIEEVDTKEKDRTRPLLNEVFPDDREGTTASRENPRGDGSSNVDRTDRGDWSIEEVDSRKRPAAKPSDPKSTEKGDWKIEEVGE